MTNNPDDKMLDDLFEQARATPIAPTDDLLRRVIADADQAMPGHRPRQAKVRTGPWAALRDALGGWPAVSGVAMAGIVGVWFGLAPPAAVETLAADILGTQTGISLLPDVDFVESWENVDGS
jgi:hypothetical protein